MPIPENTMSLKDMSKEQIGEMLERAEEWINSPEAEPVLEALGKKMREIEEEYRNADRLSIELLRTPMNC